MANRNLQEVESVFHAALDLPIGDRSAYIRQACNGDEALVAEVSSLISSVDKSNGFMEQPVLTDGFNVLLNSSKDSLLGKVFGCYRIIAPLGKGGMGDVYLAEDTRLNRNVALKFLSMEFVGDNWAKRQLLKEAQSVAMLDHPNICQVYGIEDHDERSFIVMQYVKGTTLAELIRKQTLTVDEVLSLAKQIVSALAEAHAHGIIHRDIKPKNIMVTANQQVKVLDFGLAKTVQRMKTREADDSISNVSQNGLRLGTVPYMSPEQLREERLDYRSDVFSVGIVLYEMLCGKNPFSRDNVAETISATLSSNPVPLQQTGTRCGDLAQIVRKCLEKKGEDRYQSANDVLIALDSVRTKSGNLSSKSSFPQWKTLSSRRAFGAVLAIGILTLLCFVLYAAFVRATKPKSVAIFPIENKTGDPNFNYMGDGLTDTITTKISRASRLNVLPLSVLARYDKNVDVKLIARDLELDSMLTATIVGTSERPYLQAKLLSGVDGRVLWEKQYPVDMSNVFTIEAEISQKIISTMESMSAEDELYVKEVVGPANAEARRLHWLGQYYFKNRGDKKTLEQAIKHFKSAIELEPAYAEAHAGLADCYASMNVVAYGQADTVDAMNKAVKAANDALQLNPQLAQAHTSLATVYMKYYWDWQAAEDEFKLAIKLDRKYAPAHYGYSRMLTIRGRFEEAISEGRIARDLDPLSGPTIVNHCRAMFFAGKSEALACYDKLVEEHPNYPMGHYCRALVHFHLGRHDEAIATLEKLYAADKRSAGAMLGYVYGQRGRKADAERILNEMLLVKDSLPPQELAMVYLGLGDMDKALTWFEESAKTHFDPFSFILVDPMFEKLRAEPRFMNLVRKYEGPFPH